MSHRKAFALVLGCSAAACSVQVDGEVNADTLDGLDSAQFASSSVEPKIDAVQTSVGAGLGANVTTLGTTMQGAVSTLDTVATDVTTLKTSAGAGLGANVAAIKLDAAATRLDAANVRTSVGDGLSARIDKLLARDEYSMDCEDAWVAAVWGSTTEPTGYEACMRDGRWHLAYDLSATLTPPSTRLTKLNELVAAGASVRVTSDHAFVISQECARVEKRASGRVLCIGPMNEHPSSGKGAGGVLHNFHFIGVGIDTDGRFWHTAYMVSSYGGAPIAYGPAGGTSTWGTWADPATSNKVRFWVRF